MHPQNTKLPPFDAGEPRSGDPQMAELMQKLYERNMTIEEYQDALDELHQQMLMASNDTDLQVNLNAHLVILTYGLIVIVSLVGNLLVCKIAFSGRRCGRNRRQRTTTDLLIGSLALSDLIMTIFNIPINIMRILMPHWPFGSFLCYFFPFVQTSCVYVSTFTMTAIALHRWRTVSPNALANRLVHYSNRMLIGFVWILACALALPTVAFNTLKEAKVNGERVIRCRVHYPTLPISMSLILTVEIFITQYLLPLLITCFLYTKIARVVTKQGRLVAAAADDEKRRRRHLEAKRRRIIMLVTVVLVFAACWLPLSLYHLIIDFGLANHKLSVFLVCHWFAMSSVCYNSLIYCWLNTSFRQSAKQTLEEVFRCLKYQSKNGSNGGDANGNQAAAVGTAAATTTARAGGGGGFTNATMAPQSQFLGVPQQFETTTIMAQMADEMTIAPGCSDQTALVVPGLMAQALPAVNHFDVSKPGKSDPHGVVNCAMTNKNLANIDIVVQQQEDNRFVTVLKDGEQNFDDLDGDANSRSAQKADATIHSNGSSSKRYLSIKRVSTEVTEDDTDDDDFDEELFEFSERF